MRFSVLLVGWLILIPLTANLAAEDDAKNASSGDAQTQTSQQNAEPSEAPSDSADESDSTDKDSSKDEASSANGASDKRPGKKAKADDSGKKDDAAKKADKKKKSPDKDPAPKSSPSKSPPKDKGKLAITDLSQAKTDPDFLLQGEYLGWMHDRAGFSRPLGLQVIAGGDGKFDAVLLPGGLPATGWNRVERHKLKGNATDGLLVLQGDLHEVVVSYNQATVLDRQGNRLGELKKVRRRSPTLGLEPPPGAYVVFDGSGTDEFRNQPKLTADGNLLAGALTKATVGDFRLHLEFCTPYMPYARGQGRSNSGVYIQQRYEVQILDSFGLEGVENECAALYKQQRPDVNMALPPLAWQTYDIYFTAPRFAGDGKTKISNARITVLHNGVPVHLHREIVAKTGGGKQEGAEAFPINLQDHSNPVMFRNIWLIPNQGDYAYGVTPFYCQDPPRGWLRRRRH